MPEILQKVWHYYTFKSCLEFKGEFLSILLPLKKLVSKNRTWTQDTREREVGGETNEFLSTQQSCWHLEHMKGVLKKTKPHQLLFTYLSSPHHHIYNQHRNCTIHCQILLHFNLNSFDHWSTSPNRYNCYFYFPGKKTEPLRSKETSELLNRMY